MRLEGKTVFITGSGSGIGRASALRSAEEGATVISTDVDGDAAKETAEEIREAGGSADHYEFDVTDADAFGAAIEDTAENHGFDVLVNNAGIGQPPGKIEDVDESVLDYVIDVNLKGPWNGTHAVLPIMKEQGHGTIVNMSSLAGKLGFSYQSVYALTKAAVINFTRATAAEAGPDGIRANAICPGFIDTQLTDAYFAGRSDPEAAREEMIQDYPLRRLGKAEEIADCVVFLASEESSFVTGHALTADGGYSIS